MDNEVGILTGIQRKDDILDKDRPFLQLGLVLGQGDGSKVVLARSDALRNLGDEDTGV